MGDPAAAEVTVPDTSPGCWANAGTHTSHASTRVTPTARRKRVPWYMSFIARSSSCGSSHGREAVRGDQLAIRGAIRVGPSRPRQGHNCTQPALVPHAWASPQGVPQPATAGSTLPTPGIKRRVASEPVKTDEDCEKKHKGRSPSRRDPRSRAPRSAEKGRAR